MNLKQVEKDSKKYRLFDILIHRPFLRLKSLFINYHNVRGSSYRIHSIDIVAWNAVKYYDPAIKHAEDKGRFKIAVGEIEFTFDNERDFYTTNLCSSGLVGLSTPTIVLVNDIYRKISKNEENDVSERFISSVIEHKTSI